MNRKNRPPHTTVKSPVLEIGDEEITLFEELTPMLSVSIGKTEVLIIPLFGSLLIVFFLVVLLISLYFHCKMAERRQISWLRTKPIHGVDQNAGVVVVTTSHFQYTCSQVLHETAISTATGAEYKNTNEKNEKAPLLSSAGSRRRALFLAMAGKNKEKSLSFELETSFSLGGEFLNTLKAVDEDQETVSGIQLPPYVDNLDKLDASYWSFSAIDGQSIAATAGQSLDIESADNIYIDSASPREKIESIYLSTPVNMRHHSRNSTPAVHQPPIAESRSGGNISRSSNSPGSLKIKRRMSLRDSSLSEEHPIKPEVNTGIFSLNRIHSMLHKKQDNINRVGSSTANAAALRNPRRNQALLFLHPAKNNVAN